MNTETSPGVGVLLTALWVDPFVRVLALLMLVLALWDLISFVRRRHVDCRSLIMGLGLLGTFVGIFLGLWRFDVAHIESSVPSLLSGLKLAFLTSIVGMAVSLAVHLLENLLQGLGLGPPRAAPVKDTQAAHLAAIEVHLAGWDEAIRGLDLQTIEQRLAAIDTGLGQSLAVIGERQQEQTALLQELRSDVYEERRRFAKVDGQGRELGADAGAWDAVLDRGQGLYWQARSRPDGAVDWPDGVAKAVADAQGVAGFDDWRLPTLAELQAIAPTPNGLDRRWFAEDDGDVGFPWCCSADTAEDGESCVAVNGYTGEVSGWRGGRVLLVRKGGGVA